MYIYIYIYLDDDVNTYAFSKANITLLIRRRSKQKIRKISC